MLIQHTPTLRRMAALLALLSSLLSSALLAVPAQDLYVGEIAVDDESDEKRDAAVLDAFRQVLVKLSGNSKLPATADAKALEEAAPQYVTQFLYRTEQGDGGVQRYISVQFDADTLGSVLREKGIALWSGDRPAPLVWLVVEEDSGRKIAIPADTTSPYEALNRAAYVRGLPLVTPLMDLQERAGVKPDTLWGGSEAAIKGLSERYDADAIIVGRLSQASESEWKGRWSLYLGGKASEWSQQAASRDGVVASGVDRAVDLLARRFTSVAASGVPTELRIHVGGVTGPGDFSRITEYLKGLNAVDEAKPMDVGFDSLTLLVKVKGGRETLEQAIALGRVLQPGAPPLASVKSVVPPRPKPLQPEAAKKAIKPEPKKQSKPAWNPFADLDLPVATASFSRAEPEPKKEEPVPEPESEPVSSAESEIVEAAPVEQTSNRIDLYYELIK